MTSMFFYGTLRHVPLLELVLDRSVQETVQQATLADHFVSDVDEGVFPTITACPDATAGGIVLHDLSDSDKARLDFYEGGFAYSLLEKTVRTPTGDTQIQVYFPDADNQSAGKAWSLDDWVRDYADLTLLAANEAMSHFGSATAAETQDLFPFFRARAWSRLMAQKKAPATLRMAGGRDRVSWKDRGQGYDGFFRLVNFDVSHKRFDGADSPTLNREVFVGYDAALVLPYDPVRDQVLLIEQLRYGVLHRGDPDPWVLEPVAGMVDALESPEDCIRREAMEEAGITLKSVEKIASVYASPGYTTDFFHCYLGLCDLPEQESWLGGLVSESEDIRSHVISCDRAMELLDSGEINVAPMAMMLMWLARHRSRLRASA